MDPSGEQRMKPIPIAQYLNRFERVGPADIEASPRPLQPKPRVVPAAEDSEARLHEAYERGRQEGQAAAEAEFAAALARQRDEFEERAKAERAAFQAQEYAKLAD